jgi:DNA-binding NtrC family response regulator
MVEILVIDDDLGEFKPGLQQALKGYMLHFAYSGREGLGILANRPGVGLVLLDIKMPPNFAEDEGREGVEVLKRIKKEHPDLPVIMLTVLTDVDIVVEAIQSGAFHYITKPLDRDKLRDAVKRAVETADLKERVSALSRGRDAVLAVHTAGPGKSRTSFQGMIGAHPLMQQLFDQIERAAPFQDMNVVVLGETGAGKDLVARAIHNCSPRSRGPFVAVNCAALPETVLEGELFGHKKGAFTGADTDREGLFVRASDGTLFLDEIGEMSPGLQSKVLRAIEYREITPVGGTPTQVDVRIVCATNRDLAKAKDEGDFREDLYYRIWDIPLTLPPLRSRKEDIPALADHFLRDCETKNRIRCTIDPDAVKALSEYDWPGNVRELASVLRRLVVFARDGHITEAQVRQMLHLGPAPAQASGTPADALAPELTVDAVPSPSPEPTHHCGTDNEEYPELVDIAEFRRVHGEIKLKEVLQRAITEAGNARSAMALLGMPDERYDAFRKTLQRLGISVRALT